MLSLLIFFLGTALFLPTLGYDFIGDDFVLIKDNPQIKSLANGPRLFLSDFHIWQYSNYYRPLIMVSFSWDYALYKENPRGYHLTNAIIHGLCSALVALLAWLLLQSPYAAVMAGALFALHPAHPEAVAFISSRTDLLATFFSLLALIAIAKRTEKGWGPILWAPLFFFLALLSKETAVVVLIPMAILLYQKNQAEQPKPGTIILKLLPSALMTIIYFFLRYLALGSWGMAKIELRRFYSPLFLFELFLRQLSLLLFPPQRVQYLYNPLQKTYPADFQFWFFGGLTIVFLAGVFYLVYRRPATAAFFALLLLPCLPALYISLYNDAITMERYLYLPSVGLALLAGWGFLQVPPQRMKGAVVGLAVILAVYTGAALWRTPLWKNEVVLFEALKQKYPASPFVRSTLGWAYGKNNRLPEAYHEAAAAVALVPSDLLYRNTLGRIYLQLALPQKAREEFLEALRWGPDYAAALEGLGLSYVLEGNREKALEYLDKALSADPNYELARSNRSALLAMPKKPAKPKMKNNP